MIECGISYYIMIYREDPLFKSYDVGFFPHPLFVPFSNVVSSL